MRLSPNFTLAEATKSQTAERLGIANDPTPTEIARMKLLCEKVLEPTRAHFGKPVIISSFYRCPRLNSEIGSKTGSQHVLGEAADIEIPGVPNDDLARWIRDNLEFDQCIREFAKPGVPDSGWVHVSYRDGACRKECLTISAAGTVKGLPDAP